MGQRTGRFSSAEAEERFRAAYAEAMADLPDPAAIHDVVTDFGRVHVYRFGHQDGVPLVLLPGRSGSTTMWAPNLPAWIAERTVYAVEILGEAGLSVQDIRSATQRNRPPGSQRRLPTLHWTGPTWSACRSVAGRLSTWRCTVRQPSRR
jgi:hypothetical protein